MIRLFLMGLNKYGKGDWRSISRYYVVTKTPTQVASHAQKYFKRQTTMTPPDRRRPSIHDIKTVTPTSAFAAVSPAPAPLFANPRLMNLRGFDGSITMASRTPNLSGDSTAAACHPPCSAPENQL